MEIVLSKFIALLFLSFIALSSMVLFIGAMFIWLVTQWFDRRLIVLHMYTSFWASLYVWVMPAWTITRRGKQNIDWGKTYIVVSNHQSLLDILVAFSLFFPFKWVSKAEIFNLPFIGWNMVLNRYIKLFRGDKRSVARMMEDATAHLRNGSSVYIFPEGTRSRDGQLKEFKSGAFILAKKLNIPILPIVINGTTHALPKYSLDFHGHHSISIDVLPEITAETVATLDEAELAQYTHQLMSEHLDMLSSTTVSNDLPSVKG